MKNLKSNILIFLLLFSLSNFSQNTIIDSLKTKLDITSNEKEKADILLLLVDNYFSTNKDSAEIYIQKTIQLTTQKENLKKSNIHAILKYAQLYTVKGDYVESQAKYDLAWSKMKDEYDYFLYNKYYGDLGVLSFYKGDFKAALKSFQNALNLAEKENVEEDQLRFLNNTALAMSYLGKAEESLDIHKKAISLAEKLNDSTALGKSFNNIGLIYEDMKEFDKALSFYLKSLKIKENGTSKIDVANSIYNVANMNYQIGKEQKDTSYYSKAENYYNQSLELAKKINYGKVVLFSKTGIATLATVRDKPEKAIEIYKSVIFEAEKTNDNQTLRITYLKIGVNYLKLNQLNLAENYFLKALPLIEKSENPSDRASIYKNLSELYYQKKQFNSAYDYFLKQYDLEKEINKNSLQEKISDFEVKYETEKKEKEIAIQKEQLLENQLAIKNRNLYAILLASALLILGIIFFGIYKKNQFKRKQLQKEIDLKDALAIIKTQNRLQEQRLRISRDLHDNIGSQLTFIISSIDNLKFISKDANEKLKDKLSTISSFTSGTIHELRDTIWAMNKSKISVEDLHSRILSFIEKAKIAVPELEFEILYTIDKNTSFSSLIGMNLFRVIQEAINNAIKYADATKLEIHLKKDVENFVISIIDNGKGFNINSVDLGNGLSNMEKRMSEIDAKVSINSKEKIGTEIRLEIALKNTSNDV